jgi:hypothetical protein
MHQNVFVPTDASTASDRNLRAAITLARTA